MSNNKTLYVGIDAHSTHNFCCFMDINGNLIRKIFAVPNSLPGAEELTARILETADSKNFTHVKVATEATSFYDFHLIEFLVNNKKLLTFNLLAYRFNPKTTKSFKKTYPDKNKTDPDCAFAIADRLRFGRLPEPYQQHQPYAPLQRLTRFRHHLVKSISTEKTYFSTHLFLKYSAYSKVSPFSNTFGATSSSIITDFFSLDELAVLSLQDMVKFLIKKSKNRFHDPEKIAKKVQTVIRESYRIRPSLASSVNLILSMTIKNIKALEKSLKIVDKTIAQELKAFPNTLISVQGLGPVYTAGIIAEVGNINRFSSQAKLAKFAGITWRKTSSGKFTAQITRMTKTGNDYLRYYLMEAANSLRMHNEEFRQFYNKKYHEVTEHQHKRAVALSSRKLVRLVFALLSKNQLYQA